MEFQLLPYTYTVYLQAESISVGSTRILILIKLDVMTLSTKVTWFSGLLFFLKKSKLREEDILFIYLCLEQEQGVVSVKCSQWKMENCCVSHGFKEQ